MSDHGGNERGRGGDRSRRPDRRGTAGGGRGRSGDSGAGPRSRRPATGRTAAGAGRSAGGERDRPSGPPGPPIDDDIDVATLDRGVQRELRSLPTGLAEAVGKHLLMVGRLIDDDAPLALQHAARAHRLASRVACVREALAIAAYANDDYRTALREARTVRRMTGDDAWLPMIADCERGLGRPERALDTLLEADIPSLEPSVRAESLIVLAGARRDLGQVDAALHALEDPLLRSRTQAAWLARMRLAYADLLAEAGRDDESARWLRLAEAADPDGTTVDPERMRDVDDVVIFDVPIEPEPPAGTEPATEPGAEAAEGGRRGEQGP